MSKLHDIDDAALASRRNGLCSLQRVRSLPETPRHPSAYIPQDRCDQVAQSRKNCRPRTKEKGEHLMYLRIQCADLYHQSLFDGNGLPASQSETGTPPPNQISNRRVSHKTSSGGSERSNSPVSRTETPSLHPNIAPQHIFDGVSLPEHTFQSSALPSLQLRHLSPGSTSSFNDRNLEPPQTYEGLVQANSLLKTRVNELEVINDLYRGTVTQYEQGGAPQAEMIPRSSEGQLKQHLQQALQREEALKRQVEELEREVAELRGEQPPMKRTRLDDAPEYPEPPSTFTNGLHP